MIENILFSRIRNKRVLMEYKCKQDSDTGATASQYALAFITLKFKTWRERLRLFQHQKSSVARFCQRPRLFLRCYRLYPYQRFYPGRLQFIDLVLYVQKSLSAAFTSSTRASGNSPNSLRKSELSHARIWSTRTSLSDSSRTFPWECELAKGKRPQNKFGGQRQDDRAVKPASLIRSAG